MGGPILASTGELIPRTFVVIPSQWCRGVLDGKLHLWRRVLILIQEGGATSNPPTVLPCMPAEWINPDQAIRDEVHGQSVVLGEIHRLEPRIDGWENDLGPRAETRLISASQPVV